MIAKHTAGPWHRNIKPARKYTTIYSGRNKHVAHLATQGLTDEEIESNCDLIKAAPQLYAALKTLMTEGVADGWMPPADDSRMRDAAEALARAEGAP